MFYITERCRWVVAIATVGVAAIILAAVLGKPIPITRLHACLLQVLDARRQLEELLKVNPQWRQAQTLKAAVDDQVVKEGLLGIGVATAIGGVAALILAAALGARR